MAFYLLLIIPHLLGLWGMFWFAFRSDVLEPTVDELGEEGRGDDGGPDPGPPPSSPASGGGLPLPGGGAQPPRRLRVGEQLADLHPRPSRRDREPEPNREPAPSPSR